MKMKHLLRLLLPSLLLVIGSQANSQNALNTTQVGHLTYAQTLSEVRGALHNGREYALVGVNNGFSIVDVEDPANPTEVFFEQGPNSIWRDPFYHNGHAYCVTEGGGGMLIVDMSPLPSSTNLTTTQYTGSTYSFSASHNMFIDTDNDKAYIFGSDNGNGHDGAIILDISNPMAPVELGVWSDHYVHDGFVRGDTLWASCLEEGTFIIDVSNPSNPVVLTSWDTPSEFGHNVWPSDDNQFCYTTDEVNSGFIAGYDVSDHQNVVETDRVRHPLSEQVIPHNAHFINDYVVTSHYRDGLTIHDVSDPSNIVLTGYFDSSPLEGGGFNGAWGAWPYLPSGNLLVADIEEGLFILSANYTRAAKLEGVVTEFGTTTTLNDVLVTVTGAGLTENTNIFGEYVTGTAVAGTYDVTFQKAGYISQTVSGVQLVNGQTEVLDVELVPDVAFQLSGMVTEEGTGNPIPGASIKFFNELFDIDVSTNGSGNYTENDFYGGTYEVYVAAWGYVGQCVTVQVSSGGTPPSFELARGYHDDFSLDLGWSVSGDASAGVWERGVPVETTFDNSISNPGDDANGDCGDMAFVTGNGGGSAGNDDVDDGITILKSPMMDLTDYTSPEIQFDYWFFNDGGSSQPNDHFSVKVDNGTDVVLVGSLDQSNGWTPYTISVAGITTITSTMQLVVEVEDSEPGHLVEGALDKFRVVEPIGVFNQDLTPSVDVYPNPTNNFINIKVNSLQDAGFMQMFDITGKKVMEQAALVEGVNTFTAPSVPGVYICQLTLEGQTLVKRLIVQ